MDQRFVIAGLVVLISIKNAGQGILVPIIAQTYESFNFVLITYSVQFILFFGAIYLYLNNWRFRKPNHLKIIIVSGVFMALMALLMLYAANPNRTPIIFQVVLASMPILPSFFLRKKFIKKFTVYDYKYIIPSFVLIGVSIVLCVIPVAADFHARDIIWIIMFATGILCLSSYNVAQEKYLTDTRDSSINNKIGLIFYSKLVELLIIISFSWLELLIGNESNPIHAFEMSAIKYITNLKAFLFLEGFVLAYLVAFFLSVYLNSISSNYNMLTVVISNPLVAIFFTVFREFDTGIKYPLYIIIPAICLNIGSIMLWIKGERKKEDYESIEDEVTINA